MKTKDTLPTSGQASGKVQLDWEAQIKHELVDCYRNMVFSAPDKAIDITIAKILEILTKAYQEGHEKGYKEGLRDIRKHLAPNPAYAAARESELREIDKYLDKLKESEQVASPDVGRVNTKEK